MSVVLSYLILPLVLLILVVNVIFRIGIIKKYRKLRDRNVLPGGSLIINTDKIMEQYGDSDPELAREMVSFARSLKILVIFAIVGFIVILALFLGIYMEQS